MHQGCSSDAGDFKRYVSCLVPARQRLENVERPFAPVEAPSHARRWGTRREGAAVLDGQHWGMTYGSWRGTNVQSRVNWPSMPLRLVTLPFKVPTIGHPALSLHHLVAVRGRAPEQGPAVLCFLEYFQLRAGETGPGLCW